MNPEPLPPELRDLEQHLARRPCPEPPPELRQRLLRAAHETRPQPAVARGGRPWPIVWRVAAAVVLALNLGMAVANGIRFRGLTPAPRAAAMQMTEAPTADSRWSALAAGAVASLAPAPDAGPLGRDFFSQNGGRQWDMP